MTPFDAEMNRRYPIRVRAPLRLVLALMLAGGLISSMSACAHTPPAPEPVIVTKEVMVPVAKACVPPNLKPEPDWRVTGDTIARAPTPEDRYTAAVTGFKERDDRLKVVEPVIAKCR